jgi:hypothetical protein
MPSYTFHSHDPDAFSLAFDPARPGKTAGEALALGERAEKAMADPAYFDQNHRNHYRAVSEATAAIEAIVGRGPVDGGQPFHGLSFSSVDGSVRHPHEIHQLAHAELMLAGQAQTFFDPNGALPDEHNVRDDV